MTRYEKLSLYLQACAATPFEWGCFDCCVFTAQAVQVQTSRDPMADLPLYRDAEGAAAMLAANGGIESMVTQRLGEPVAPALAQRGDVVLFDTVVNGDAIGICAGASFAAVTEDGLQYFSMRHARLAWRVA